MAVDNLALRSICILAATLVAGCAGNGGTVGSIGGGSTVSYTASNAIAPNGYSEAILGPGQYRIRATGDGSHSRAALEKLAMVRAADLAQQQHTKFFRIDAVNENITCGHKKTVSGRETKELVSRSKRMVDIDVTFAKEAADPAWVNGKDAFPILRGELDSAGGDAATSEAAKTEMQAKCGSV
jgi:hypothetical protein